MRTVFIECEYFLTKDKHRAVLENMKYEAGDDVRIVLLEPGMRVAEPASQWIPVSERLPEVHPFQIDEPDGQFNIAEDYCVTSDLVLVQTTDGRMAVALYEDDLDGRTYWEAEPYGCLDVVAWMPLPEPYEEVTT